MKLSTLLLVVGSAIGVSLTAHAGSGYAGSGYAGSGYGHHGYGNGYYRHSYHDGAHQRRRHKRHGSGYKVLGGLIVGGIIGHLITRDHYYHRRGPAYHDTYYGRHEYPSSRTYYQRPVYRQYPVSRSLGPRYVQGSHRERILQNLDGSCFLIATAETGEETRRPLSSSMCY